jgi:hypothetical protein
MISLYSRDKSISLLRKYPDLTRVATRYDPALEMMGRSDCYVTFMRCPACEYIYMHSWVGELWVSYLSHGIVNKKLDFPSFFSILSSMKKLMRLPSTLPPHAIKKDIVCFISKQTKIITFFLGKKRAVFLSKYIDCQDNRRDRSRRYSVFFPCIELLKTSTQDDIISYTQSEWEVLWICPNGTTCAAHIREDYIGKDKFLFLISTFEKT